MYFNLELFCVTECYIPSIPNLVCLIVAEGSLCESYSATFASLPSFLYEGFGKTQLFTIIGFHSGFRFFALNLGPEKVDCVCVL